MESIMQYDIDIFYELGCFIIYNFFSLWLCDFIKWLRRNGMKYYGFYIDWLLLGLPGSWFGPVNSDKKRVDAWKNLINLAHLKIYMDNMHNIWCSTKYKFQQHKFS